MSEIIIWYRISFTFKIEILYRGRHQKQLRCKNLIMLKKEETAAAVFKNQDKLRF